jgi:rubrerythrin
LKVGFTSEATAAARYRAYAQAAGEQGLPKLAQRWLELAGAKDELAIRQLIAAGQVRDAARNVADALAEERFENDVLYPKMIRDLEGDEAAAAVLREVVASQADHIDRLDQTRKQLLAASGDID